MRVCSKCENIMYIGAWRVHYSLDNNNFLYKDYIEMDRYTHFNPLNLCHTIDTTQLLLISQFISFNWDRMDMTSPNVNNIIVSNENSISFKFDRCHSIRKCILMPIYAACFVFVIIIYCWLGLFWSPHYLSSENSTIRRIFNIYRGNADEAKEARYATRG